MKSSTAHVDIFCLLSFSIKKRLTVTVTSMAVTVAVTMIVSVIMTSVSDFMATENSHLNNIEVKACTSSHKLNVLLDWGGIQKSTVGGK